MQHATRLTQPRRMLQRSRDKTAQRAVQTSGTSGSAYRKKWVTSTIFKKYLHCILAARILKVDFVVCALPGKKESGQVSTCRIGPIHCQTNCGAHLTSYPVGTAPLSPGVKQQVCETNHSSPSNAEVKKSGAIPPLHYVFMAQCLTIYEQEKLYLCCTYNYV
jgi:hypothetical protein